jgi:hypothetical protein
MPTKDNYFRFLNISIIYLALVAACKLKNEKSISTMAFQKPIICQSPIKDSISDFKIDFIVPGKPLFMGKRKFREVIIDHDKRSAGTTFSKDYIRGDKLFEMDALITSGFELVCDYTSRVYAKSNYWMDNSAYHYYYYPVYLVNSTQETKTLIGIDDHLYGIQEALDKNGTWRPIECEGYDHCGNGLWGLYVHQQEYVILLFRVYSGHYKTKLRVKIQNRDYLYASGAFDGTIDEKQFNLSKDDLRYLEESENKVGMAKTMFYGALPMEISH